MEHRGQTRTKKHQEGPRWTKKDQDGPQKDQDGPQKTQVLARYQEGMDQENSAGSRRTKRHK